MKTLASIEAWIDLCEVQLALQPEVDWLTHRIPGGYLFDSTIESFSRRLWIRSMIAYVDATTHVLKRTAIRMAPGLLSELESANLVDEVTYGIDSTGAPKESVSKLRLAPNALFALKLFARAAGCSYEHDDTAQGWKDFRDAIEIHERLRQPRGRTDLKVSDKEQRVMQSALDWFAAQANVVFALAKASIDMAKASNLMLIEEKQTADYQEKFARLMNLNVRVNAAGKPPPQSRFDAVASRALANLQRVFVPVQPHTITITLDAELIAALDAQRTAHKQRTGVEYTRPRMAGTLLTDVLAPRSPKR